ncbi:type I polyketide synthase [Synechococcus sp. W4D4]|uniref:type I polyketide synthase n=1 Tax=Synechococcus sp. W4D4 TaxID=3392294 RepID=UPI0039E87B5D
MAQIPQAPEPIAIVGIGCRLPGGSNSANAFWELLRDGRDAITEIPEERWDLGQHFNADPQTPLHQHVRHGGFIDGIDQFDPAFFGISPREAVCMDPQQRLLMEVAWQAMEDAGIPLEQIRGTTTGVFMGISSSDYSSLLWASAENYAIPDNEPFVLPGNTGCIAANRLSYFFDFKGPSFTVDTACSSSLVAVHLACESLWRGESRSALAGGVQALIHAGLQSAFCKAGLLAPDGRCKSFDAAANGYVRSEGAGAVLLKPLSAAQADGDRIYALIHGTAVNSDGRSNGMVAPNLRAQIACVRKAFARAGIAPAATQYVEAHGTGTRQGDPIELRALGTVLSDGRPEGETCRVGSVKTNLGHSETAAGITGLIKAALCVHHRQLPPSLHFRSPNPSIDFAGLKLQVQTQLEPFPQADAPAVVGVSSFGFGGTNAHAVLGEAPKAKAPARFGAKAPLQLLTLSARSEQALQAQAQQVHQLLSADPRLQLADLCASANQQRSHLGRRLTALAADREQLLAQLAAVSAGSELPLGVEIAQASRRPGKLAFLFTGQGSQALGMAQELYGQHPVFREAFDRCTPVLDPLLPKPLRAVLFSSEPEAAELLNQTGFSQPAIFAVGYGLSQLWISWGLRPDLLLGHSVGEVVAAHLAGVFALEDALQLIAARGRLMQALPSGGGMLALLASKDQAERMMAQVPGLSLAALNGPTNTVLSGPLEAIQLLEQRATEAGIKATRLAVSHAFHSPAMAPMLAEFEQLLSQIDFRAPVLPLMSNLTGRLAGPEIASSDYWCDHVIHPVRFAEGIEAAAAQGVSTFIELGARPTLIGMGRQCLSDPELQWWPSLRPGQPDVQQLFSSLAGLYRQGFAIDWKALHRPFPHRRIELPAYPFQRQRYWWSGVQDGASLWLDHIKGGSTAPAAPRPVVEAGRLEPLSLPGGQEQRFQIQLSAQHLLDHRIRSQVVFPAAGFIDLALQALVQSEQPLALRDLNLDQPLRLDDALTPVQLVLGQQLEFHSEGPNGWRSHGRCLAGVDEPPTALSELPTGAGRALNLQVFYEALARFGLSYGPSFRPITQLVRDGEQAWATLQRPTGAADWTLLDGCFQAVAATLDPDAAAGQLFLPVGFEQLELHQFPLPDALECRVQLRASDEPAFVKADLQLFAGGERIGWVQGFRLRRLPRQALDWLFPLPEDESEPQPERGWLVRQGWVPLDVALGELLAEHPSHLPLHWPDPEATSVQQATEDLLALAQTSPTEIWLVLEGTGPVQEALAAFARTAALERPATRWFTLQISGKLPIPWPQIQELAATEPVIAFDGERLFKQRLLPLPPARFRYSTGSFGMLESLRPGPLAAQTPAAGELEIAVEATGLNFRDVLNALGLLRSYSRQLGLDEAAQVPFGGECVGRVTSVGDGVDPELVGQRVLAALAVGSLASHVVCRSELCVPVPEQLTPEQGASVSTAFLTAIYGLETLARLQPGESVLIHAGAGGVGQAALQVALRCGATVYATASSAKQARLLEQGCTAVFDSRSFEFSEQLLAATGGQGVDVVLNSLKGEWVDASFDALAQGGRFIELGKIEIWSKAEASERRPDARYLPFDLLEVASAEPALVRGLLEQLMADLADGSYQLLPLQSFPVEQSVEAFRLMAQARHVGKVVITQPERPVAAGIRAEGSYLITGAFGGIGLQLARWLVEQGAKSLVLVARSAANPSPDAQQLLKDCQDKGVACLSLALDLSDQAAVEPLAVALQDVDLRGVFHAAGVLDDGLLEWQTPERLAGVLAPKWSGWHTIETALQFSRLDPELVVQFSSMAALLGSPGQSNYAAANGTLDGAMVRANRPGWMSLQWGPWAGGGMARALEDRQKQRLEALGVRLLEPNLALEALGELIARGASGSIGVLDVEWARIARNAGSRQGAPLELMAAAAQQDSAEAPSGPPPTVALLLETPVAERRSLLQGFVQQQLAKVMGVADPDQIDPGEPLFNMGLDSLMALELMVLLEKNLGITLTEALVFEHPTIEDLVAYFLSVLFPEQSAARAAAVVPAPAVAESIDQAWDEQLQAVAELDEDELLRQLQGGS